MISKSLGKLSAAGPKQATAGEDDTTGVKYNSIEQMWQSELDPAYIEAMKQMKTTEESKEPIGSKDKWYKGSTKYWDEQPVTIDGVLGGYGKIHPVDTDTSRRMIDAQKGDLSGLNWALDCGAGIGRITKDTLQPVFANVDLLEPSKVQIDKAREYVPEVRNFYQMGLQELQYERKYDCVWIQWCLCYLTDSDLHDFLVKTRQNGLEFNSETGKSGLIFVKENVAGKKFILDRSDNSVMRTSSQFSEIFEGAGFTIVKQFLQRGLPSELHHINCFVLRPNAEYLPTSSPNT